MIMAMAVDMKDRGQPAPYAPTMVVMSVIVAMFVPMRMIVVMRMVVIV